MRRKIKNTYTRTQLFARLINNFFLSFPSLLTRSLCHTMSSGCKNEKKIVQQLVHAPTKHIFDLLFRENWVKRANVCILTICTRVIFLVLYRQWFFLVPVCCSAASNTWHRHCDESINLPTFHNSLSGAHTNSFLSHSNAYAIFA